MEPNKVEDVFAYLTQLIKEYDKNKNSYDRAQLQDLRDNISLNLYYLSDAFSIAISNHNMAEHNRKIKTAELELKYRAEGYTIAEAENRTRIDCKLEAERETKALKQKERVRIVISSVSHILNSLSTRINNITK